MYQTRRLSDQRKLVSPLALLISLILSTLTRADAIKLSGLWIEDVTIQGINDSTLTYVTSVANEAQCKLADVQGIRLTAIPELGQAEAMLESGKDLPRAVALLGEVRGKAGQAWLRDWATYRQMFAAAAAQQPMEAVNAYLTLARSAPTAFYLQSFPPQGLKAITNDSLRQEILRVVDAGLGQIEGEAAVAVKQLRTDIAGIQFSPAGAPDDAANDDGQTALPPTPTEAPAAPDKPVLPRNTPKIAYVVDASGSLMDTLPFVIQELKKTINELSDQQSFTVIFAVDGKALEIPPSGLKQATPELKEHVIAWLNPRAGNIAPGGATDLLPSISQALGYRPQLLYILSDNVTGRGQHEREQKALAAEIERANTGGTKINTIQLFYPDALTAYGFEPTLKIISDKTGGVYKFVDAGELGLR